MPSRPFPSDVERASSRTLIPHEHGAYGALLVPLATALAIGRPTLPAVALVLASGLAFVAHEPVLVLLGRRGPRSQREDGARARRYLAVLVPSILTVGGPVAFVSGWTLRLSLLVPATLAAIYVALLWRRLERSVVGEIVAAVTLASAVVPVAVASGVSIVAAVTCWLVFAVGSLLATVSVRAVIAGAKGSAGSFLPRVGTILVVSAAVMATLLAVWRLVPLVAILALAPVLLIALGLSIVPPHPRHLRKIGWSLVAASLLTAVILVVGLRQLS